MSSTNGKFDEKYFKPKPRQVITLQENKKMVQKPIKRGNDKKLSHLVMGNQLDQLEKE